MRCDGKTAPRKPWRVIDRIRFGLRDRLEEKVTVTDGENEYVFVCTNRFEVWRAATLLAKEEGTIAWFRSQTRPGDVVYDVGANIGLYSIFAGPLVGETGRVFAFEPHAVNFVHLCRNIMANGLGGRVVPLSLALADRPGYSPFNYLEWGAASSFSQFGTEAPPTAIGFSELKYGSSVDEMVEAGALPPPDLVKIDVDGLEERVIEGMRRLLAGPNRPRSIQTEIPRLDNGRMESLFDDMGYALRDRHFTAAGKHKLARGLQVNEIHHNALFEPA